MGDTKAASGTPFRSGTRSATSSTARRSARYSSRSSASTSRNLESVRPPIVLEIGSSIIRVGYADSASPAHLIPVSGPASSILVNYSEAEWYTALSPWIEIVYDRLLCPPKTRKVLIVHASLYVPRAWRAAMEQLLWNQGAPAISFVSALDVIPMAQGWKRGLIVLVSKEEAACICHSDGDILPFTYQSVPECGYGSLMKDSNTLQTNWTDEMRFALEDELHNPNALVVALLKCLESCPRDLRYDVIHNIVVCGDGALILPDLGRRVSSRLEQILEGTQDELVAPETLEDLSPMVAIPVPMSGLKSLGTHLRLLDCKPHRPDFFAWVGSSIWAATWNRYDAEESRIDWKLASTE